MKKSNTRAKVIIAKQQGRNPKMSEFKILGETLEEFMVRWNAITFQLGGLNEKSARKLARIYVNELKMSLKSHGIDLQDFFLNLSRGGSISTVKVAEATTPSKIKKFYRHNLWGTSIPYTVPIAVEMSPSIEGKNILDVGCGFGRLALLCALRKASRVVAVDLSHPLIQTLERTVHLLNLRNVETHVKDVENLDFEPNQFDIIYCCEVIEHLPDPKKALRILNFVLKPNGSLILSTPNSLNTVGFKQKLLKIFGYNWISPYGAGQPELHAFTPMSIRSLLASCGFEIKALRGAELLDNLAILYPGNYATGLLQFLPLLFPSIQKIKNGLVRLGKTRLFRKFGLELFIRAIPRKNPSI